MLIEISETEARLWCETGPHRVFAHAFDPAELSHFDKNGFQQWTMEGSRLQAARFFIDVPEFDEAEFNIMPARILNLAREQKERKDKEELLKARLASRVTEADRSQWRRLWEYLTRRKED